MRDAEFGAKARHFGSFGGAFLAQAVIDRGGGDPPGKRRMGQDQQRETVRPAGYRQPDAAFARTGRRPVGSEPCGQAGGNARVV